MVEGDEVAKQFAQHFKSFLGQSIPVVDLSRIDDIFTKKLSNEEAQMMIRDVTNEELKSALFYFGENKASGEMAILQVS